MSSGRGKRTRGRKSSPSRGGFRADNPVGDVHAEQKRPTDENVATGAVKNLMFASESYLFDDSFEHPDGLLGRGHGSGWRLVGHCTDKIGDDGERVMCIENDGGGVCVRAVHRTTAARITTAACRCRTRFTLCACAGAYSVCHVISAYDGRRRDENAAVTVAGTDIQQRRVSTTRTTLLTTTVAAAAAAVHMTEYNNITATTVRRGGAGVECCAADPTTTNGVCAKFAESTETRLRRHDGCCRDVNAGRARTDGARSKSEIKKKKEPKKK